MLKNLPLLLIPLRHTRKSPGLYFRINILCLGNLVKQNLVVGFFNVLFSRCFTTDISVNSCVSVSFVVSLLYLLVLHPCRFVLLLQRRTIGGFN